VEVGAQCEGGEKPEENADGSAGGEPVPATGFYVGRPVVDDGEGEGEEGGCEEPSDEAGDESEEGGEEVVFDGMVGEGGEEVSAEQAGEGEGDDGGEDNRDADGGETCHEVGAGFFDLVDGIEGILNGGDAYGCRPDGGNESEGEFAGGGGGGGLVESCEDGAEGGRRDNEGEVAEEIDVDGGGRAGGEAEERAGAEEGWEEREEEVEAEFGGAAEEVVGEEGLPGAFGDDAEGDALEVPEGMQGSAGDVIPDALLPEVAGRIDSVIDADDRGNLGRRPLAAC